MPLNYEQAKDQIANEENYVTWSAFESVHFYGTIKWRECNAKAAELYADSVARDAWEKSYTKFMELNDLHPDNYDFPTYTAVSGVVGKTVCDGLGMCNLNSTINNDGTCAECGLPKRKQS